MANVREYGVRGSKLYVIPAANHARISVSCSLRSARACVAKRPLSVGDSLRDSSIRR